MSQTGLEQLLKDVGLQGRVEDAAVDPIPNTTPPMSMVRNIDILSPLVDDPVIMGKIAACNATNDVFAMNCREVSGMMVFLGLPIDMPETIPRGILRGMKDFLEGIGSRISGGHTIHSGWPLMGGEAAGIEETEKIIHKQFTCRAGDVLLLTKPLGTQPAMAADRVSRDVEEMGVDLLEDLPKALVREAIQHGYQVMTQSLRPVSLGIHELADISAVHALTDVTGFGLRGTVKEILATTSLVADVSTLPVIRGTLEISDLLGYPLEQGASAETAGGMLIAMDGARVDDFTRILDQRGVSHWVIGEIRPAQDPEVPGTLVLPAGYRLESIPFRED